VGYITWDGSTAFGRLSLCLGSLSTLLFVALLILLRTLSLMGDTILFGS
jgi:hypothetical protein